MSANDVFTIVGSGFGLYGYLPAIALNSEALILLPESYRSKLLSRPDLKQFDQRITWVVSKEVAAKAATTVILAVSPTEQCTLVSSYCNFDNIKKFVIEKPVAVTPFEASKLLDVIAKSNKRFRVGYTFLNTRWNINTNWSRILEESEHVDIRWTFTAHHIANNLNIWKRFESFGGGVLRFYGIHLIALFAIMGYKNVVFSSLEYIADDVPVKWTCRLHADDLPPLDLLVDCSDNENCFSVQRSRDGVCEKLVDLHDPFQLEPADELLDSRISALHCLLNSFNYDDARFVSQSRSVVDLWMKIENIQD